MQIVVHYHEIALKGKNRNMFVKRLVANLRATYRDMGHLVVRTLFGRVSVILDSSDIEEIHRRMQGVFGVANYSIVREVDQDFAAMCQAAWECVAEGEGHSFAVRCRRADKAFHMRSMEVEREVGGYVYDRNLAEGGPLKVDLTNPETTVRIELVNGRAFVSGRRFRGPGGLPVGTGGKVVGMLSSGFDSPVACWNLMKRGAQVTMCHFHSYPFTNQASLDNCRLIANILTRYQYRTKLYLVPFATVQQELLTLTPADLRMILYRRSMVRISQKIAQLDHAEALVTGESLGQVASQTLTNMAVIDETCSIPMLRPLVGADKEEIMLKSREIGTYELSARPYEDCCSLMLSAHPCTHAELEEVKRIEAAMDLDELEEQAVKDAEIDWLTWKGNAGVECDVFQEPHYQELDGACPTLCQLGNCQE